MAERLASLPVPDVFVHDNVWVDDKTRLPDLVDESSWLIFSCLQMSDPAWLSLPVAAWREDPAYCEGKKVIQGLKVTNDVAERGVKLIQDFASSVTAQETQLQQLLLVVEKHRKELSDFKKSSLGMM